MELRPTVLGVDHVRADQIESIADAGPRQMPVVARHELDHEVAILDRVVAVGQHDAIARNEANEDVDVPVLLVADVVD